MLMLTHTWILKEFLGRGRLSSDVLDLFVYNISPDILPFHKAITSNMTHGIPRFLRLPNQYKKAAFVLFHLLVDDIAHHGKIGKTAVRNFNPNSDGYTYVKGKPLIRPIMDFYKSIGREIDYSHAAYQSHLIIEMTFDLALHQGMGSDNLVPLFCDALEYTVQNKIEEFGEVQAWLLNISEEIIADAIRQGKHTCSRDRMSRFMNVEGRVGLYLDRFGLDRNDDSTRAGIRNLLNCGMALVSDYEDFLYPTIKEIRNSPFAEYL
ncbi:MAG: hypothetical protein WC560_07355 [Syntrophales bacterium]